MSVEQTFSAWFRRLNPREQNAVLRYIRDHYFSRPSPPFTIEATNPPAANFLAGPGKEQPVCPTCKRKY